MANLLTEILTELFLVDKNGKRLKPGDHRATFYLLGAFALFVTLMAYKEIMIVASPVLLAGVVAGGSVVIAIGGILLLNRAGVIKNLLFVEFLSLVVFLSLLFALVLLFANNHFGIIV